MGREIVYCSQCGVRILEKDLATGRAFTVLDKVFCAECRDQAFSQGPGPEPAPAKAPAARPAAHAPAPAPAARKAAVAAPRPAPAAKPRPVAPPPRPEGVSAPRHVVKAKSNTPMIVGSGIGLLVLVAVILVVLLRGQGSQGKSTEGSGNAAADKAAQEKKLTPEQRAALRFDELQKFAAATPDPKAVLKRASEFEKDILRTPSEEPYKAFRTRWQRKAAEIEAGKKIDALLAEAKTMAAADPTFQKFGDVLDLLTKADAMAADDAIDKVADVKTLRNELEKPYEEAGDKWYYGNEGKLVLNFMKEGDYKGALKMLNRFPESLKHTRVYRVSISKHIDDSQKEIARAAGQEVKDWKKDLRIANEEANHKNYKKAREAYAKAEQNMPAFDSLTIDEKSAIGWMYYNWACTYADESKKLEGAEKTKAVDAAFEYLTKSAEKGVMGLSCRESQHPKAKDHMDQDEDLKTIRSDPRYAELMQKYNK